MLEFFRADSLFPAEDSASQLALSLHAKAFWMCSRANLSGNLVR
jgi:hypothetical protein